MKVSRFDVAVGSLVLLAVLGLLFLAFKVSGSSGVSLKNPYTLYAQFDQVGSLKSGAPVKSAGVVVGQVKSFALDPKTYQARLTLVMDGRYQFPEDSMAEILTSGVLGEQYVGMTAGGADKFLAPGAQVAHTQSALVLEKLINRLVEQFMSRPTAPSN